MLTPVIDGQDPHLPPSLFSAHRHQGSCPVQRPPLPGSRRRLPCARALVRSPRDRPRFRLPGQNPFCRPPAFPALMAGHLPLGGRSSISLALLNLSIRAGGDGRSPLAHRDCRWWLTQRLRPDHVWKAWCPARRAHVPHELTYINRHCIPFCLLPAFSSASVLPAAARDRVCQWRRVPGLPRAAPGVDRTSICRPAVKPHGFLRLFHRVAEEYAASATTTRRGGGIQGSIRPLGAAHRRQVGGATGARREVVGR